MLMMRLIIKYYNDDLLLIIKILIKYIRIINYISKVYNNKYYY